MANKIQLMRGTKTQLTTKGGLSLAEPGYCTDTKDLYIGNASGGDTLILAAQNIPNNKNLQSVINGGLEIWQRGPTVSYSNNFGAGNASGYGPDRWSGQVYGTGGGNSAFSHQQQTFAVGQSQVPNNPRFFERMNITSLGTTGALIRLSQSIESVHTHSGNKVTLTFWAKASSTRIIAAVLSQQFGTGGSPSAKVDIAGNPSTISLTTNWQKFSVEFSVPSISGKILGANGDDNLLLSFLMYKVDNTFVALPSGVVGSYVTGAVDISQVQLSTADVSYQPRSFAEELQLCKRYFEKSYEYGAAPGSSTLSGYQISSDSVDINGIADVTFNFSVPKRTLPTMSFFNGSGVLNKIPYNLSGGAASEITITSANGSPFQTTGQSGLRITGLSAGQSLTTLFHWTADADY